MSVNMAELEGVRLTLKQKTKFYFTGTMMLNLGILVGFSVGGIILRLTGVEKTAGIFGVIGFIISLVGIGVQGWPILKAVLFGSGIGDAITGPLKADYEVVTVEMESGRVIQSDGGAQSILMNLGSRFIYLFIVYFISGIVVGIHIIFLSVKGLGLTAKAKPKPTNKPSIGFMALKNLFAACLPLILIIIWFGMASNQYNKDAKQTTVNIEQLTTQLKVGDTVIVIKNQDSSKGTMIRPKPAYPFSDEYASYMEQVVYVKEGDTLTVTGTMETELSISGKSTTYYVPVEYQGTRGWIEAEFVTIKK